jgi:hypothetical protein
MKLCLSRALALVGANHPGRNSQIATNGEREMSGRDVDPRQEIERTVRRFHEATSRWGHR